MSENLTPNQRNALYACLYMMLVTVVLFVFCGLAVVWAAT